MKNYDSFCKSKNCSKYVEWDYIEHEYYSIHGPNKCVSCLEVGQSYNIDRYPKNCLHLKDIKQVVLKPT